MRVVLLLNVIIAHFFHIFERNDLLRATFFLVILNLHLLFAFFFAFFFTFLFAFFRFFYDGFGDNLRIRNWFDYSSVLKQQLAQR